MDKALGLVTLMFVGLPMVVFAFLISWVMDEDVDKEQSDNDSDIRIYIPSWYWKRGGLARHYKRGEKR